jgi:hypothetical protein
LGLIHAALLAFGVRNNANYGSYAPAQQRFAKIHKLGVSELLLSQSRVPAEGQGPIPVRVEPWISQPLRRDSVGGAAGEFQMPWRMLNVLAALAG